MTIHLGSLIACFVITGLLYWAATMLIKQQPFRNVALVIVVVVFVVWLLAALGIWSPGGLHISSLQDARDYVRRV